MAKPTTPQPMTRADLEQKIVALAWKDDAFRKAFLADPKAQFEKRTGRKLPPGLKITAYAEDADHLHFVIPAKPSNVKELSDADLEKVAGGISPLAVVTVAVTAISAIIVNESIRETGDPGWQP